MMLLSWLLSLWVYSILDYIYFYGQLNFDILSIHYKNNNKQTTN